MKQQKLFTLPFQKTFGGELLKSGSRKMKRPLNPKLPIHIVLRADVSGSKTLLYNMGHVEFFLQKFASRFGVRIYEKATVTNHLHLLLKFNSRADYVGFIRALTGALAKVTKVKWLHRPFTRIVTWGRDFTGAARYVVQNQLEAFRLIAYTPRKRRPLFSD